MPKTTDSETPSGTPRDQADEARPETLSRNVDGSSHLSGTLIGLARVSTTAQVLDRQIDSLTESGCTKIFTEHGVSGAAKSRPVLDEMLAYVRPGDTIVVQSLDRLGRRTIGVLELIEDLHARDVGLRILNLGIDTRTPAGQLLLTISAALAQLERDILRERTLDGLAAAKRKGRGGGRPKTMSDKQVAFAREMRDEHGKSLREISELIGVPVSTVHRRLAAHEAASA